ncbi:hypothetical protein E2P81_ATG07457 [Venturia nashicola]|uniref:Uncharacterized protein n=1 Tax=Venturia nashicola TaxID=86259 RepID=A0A4Z1P1U9_9PEZI|nr:hypothetical protein E6O75_ATG07613 [Venturia nashicola]TLD31967.1 hypothetical protein E2P81_ATG07457 [Venturia nashicola]
MENSSSSKMKQLLEGISASSAYACLNIRAPRHSLLNDTLTGERNRKISNDIPSALPNSVLQSPKEMPIPALGSFSRLPPELRSMVYDHLAQSATKALHERKRMSTVTKTGSLPPAWLLASKTAREEFAPYYHKLAWPTIMYTPDARGKLWHRTESCRKLEELLKIFLPSHDRLSHFTIVLASTCNEKRAMESWQVMGTIFDLLYQEKTLDINLDPSSTITKIRVIWCVQHWDTMQKLQTTENEFDERLNRIWHFLHEANQKMLAQSKWIRRFPVLKTLEFCVRYKEERYVYQYTAQDGKVEVDTLFVPLATRYRDRREIFAWTLSEMLDLHNAVCRKLWVIYCILIMSTLILWSKLSRRAC